MIKKIYLRYFRRHEELEVNLAPGLNLIRGSNEMGKTTLLEAVLYCLYGSKALRNSFEDVVTWGHKENELKTEVVMCIDGIDYAYKRSKSGAEVSFADDAGMPRMVTGQTEVSKFSSELLGADLKAASAMMLASQNSLRGALDEGPAAVSMLMAKLADFDLIDRVLENANSSLALGLTTMMQSRVTETQARVDQVAADSIQEEAVLIAEASEKAAVETLTAMDPKMQDAFKALYAADEDLSAFRRYEAECARAATECHLLASAIAANDIEVNRNAVEAGDSVKDADIAALQARVAREQDRDAATQAYAVFASTPFPELAWDKPEEDFVNELGQAQAAAEESLKVGVTGKESVLISLRSQMMKSGKCPTCGHDKSDPGHMERHNAEVSEKIAAAQAELAAAKSDYISKAGYRDTLLSLNQGSTKYLRRLSPLGDRVSFDLGCYPPRASWVGEVPAGAADPGPARELALAQQKNSAAARAAGRLQALSAQAATLRAQQTEKESRLASLRANSADLAALQQAHEVAAAVYEGARLACVEQKALLAVRSEEAARARQRYTQEQHVLAQCREQILKYESDIRTMNFNNAFVNKLRKMKPAITDFLWNQVLSAVSKFFSDMRGVQSVVTKESNGFMVNGESTASLSGSTLDVLALAIRCALVKTFIPHANFLVLDEPAAGCDVDRTGNVLGFVSSVGFGQVIMASHDVLSESVADNVVRLGD